MQIEREIHFAARGKEGTSPLARLSEKKVPGSIGKTATSKNEGPTHPLRLSNLGPKRKEGRAILQSHCRAAHQCTCEWRQLDGIGCA